MWKPTIKITSSSFHAVLKVIVFKEADNIYVGYAPDIDVSSYGDSEQLALEAVKEAIDIYFDYTRKKGILEEIRRLRRQILPVVSRAGLLFTLANAFDNIENVGMSYIIREYEKQTNLTFLIEIMNMYLKNPGNISRLGIKDLPSLDRTGTKL